MMKTIGFCFVVVLMMNPIAQGQSVEKDSLTLIAKRDARHFKLADAAWAMYKKHDFPYTSDYFTPNKTYTPDTALLRDSVYVNAFRWYASGQNARRHTIGHGIVVAGLITISAGVLALFIILIAADGPHFK